jgi:NAD-dependent deacetylase
MPGGAKRSKVRPNPAFTALVDSAPLAGLQPDPRNVDGLHRMAGSPQLIELHGNLQRVKCSSCGVQAEAWEEADGEVPRCEICGSLLRPDVVWFGEALPRAELESAVEAARACHVFFSIGTSGIVQPAASLAFGP